MILNDIGAKLFLDDVLKKRGLNENEFSNEFLNMTTKLVASSDMGSILTQVANQYISMYPSDDYAKEVYPKYEDDNYKKHLMQSQMLEFKESPRSVLMDASAINKHIDSSLHLMGTTITIRCKRCQSTNVITKGINKVVVNIGNKIFKELPLWVKFRSLRHGLCLDCLAKWKIR